MKIFNNKTFRCLLIIALSTLAAIGLSVRSLLSLPFFYEQTLPQSVVTFLLFSLAFLSIILITNKSLIFPYLRSYLKWNNLLFILLLILIIAFTSSISTFFYWSTPAKHTVEICFDATSGMEDLEIIQITDPKTNRLLSPKGLGVKHYPITIPSGECINGTLTTLEMKFPLQFILILNIVPDEDAPAGRLFMSINEVPSVVMIEQDSENPDEPENWFTDGLDDGKIPQYSRNKYINLFIKVFGITLSSIYLALFLFGIAQNITDWNTHNKENDG
jgi:hypothetical protein